MKIPKYLSLTLILLLMASTSLLADSWSGQFGITDDYNRRGLRVSTEGDVKTLLLEYEIDSGFYVGAWVADLDLRPEIRGDIQFDYFVGYSHRLTNTLNLDSTFIRYTNPQSKSSVNYNWNEWVTSFHYRQKMTLTLGINDNWIGRDKTTQFAELVYRYPLPFNVISDVSVGYNKTEKVLGTNYRYYEFGINRAFENLRIRAALTGTDNRATKIFGDFRTQARWNLSLAWVL